MSRSRTGSSGIISCRVIRRWRNITQAAVITLLNLSILLIIIRNPYQIGMPIRKVAYQSVFSMHEYVLFGYHMMGSPPVVIKWIRHTKKWIMLIVMRKMKLCRGVTNMVNIKELEDLYEVHSIRKNGLGVVKGRRIHMGKHCRR